MRLPTLALRLVWRDARGSPRRLVLSAVTVVVGVAALVAVRSFALDVDAAVAAQTKSLLGADLQIDSSRPPGLEAEELFAGIGGESIREIDLASMAYFPRSGGSRLVRVRAVDPGYPFYGEIEAEPASAAAGVGRREGALVDRALLLQMDARVGDRVRIGELELPIVGAVVRLPGEVPTASVVGPRVLVPRRLIERTGLIRPGSRVRYAVQFRLASTPQEIESLVEELRPALRRLQLDADTVASRRRWVGRALDDMDTFLGVTAVVALLLGAVGTASAAAVHARRQRTSMALLRCLGATGRLPLGVCAAQSVGMAAAGTVAGIGAGLALQRLLPAVVAAFLPLGVPVAVRPAALLEAGAVGLAVAVAFGLGPLLPLRRVRPLVALRADVDAPGADPLARGLPALLAAVAVLVVWRQTDSWHLAVALVAGLATTLAVLVAIAAGLRRAARRLVRGGRWEWRQGVSNLHRPHNQTLVMVLGLGTGVFLIATMTLVGRGLLADLAAIRVADGADMVLFDVQPDQLAGVQEILEREGVSVLETVPVVPMRLSRLRGRPVGAIGEDESVSSWSLRRQYNVTYRDVLTDTEEIVDGHWTGSVRGDAGRVPVSLSEEMARALDLGVGGELTFDVQGVPLPARVDGIRHVDWQQVRPNFLVVFPRGVLEGAPQQIVLVARAGGEAASASAQRAVVESFANVSVVDMALALRTIDEVLQRVRLALRFLAGLVVVAGLGVLVVATLEGRSERRREGALLRTLGASRRQIARIGLAEYLVLGGIAGIAGALLAVAASWALLRFTFAASLDPAPWSLLGVLVATLLITGLLGLWNGRAMAHRPAMELVRQSE